MSTTPPKKARESKGIVIENQQNVTLSNNRFVGLDVGIEADRHSSLSALDNTFQNVREPYRAAEAKSLSITGSRISDDPTIRERGLQSRAEVRATSGWRRLKGPPLPVFCDRCETIFPSRRHPYAGAYFNSWNNEETCPVCGNEHAKVSEGVFDLSKEAIRIISAPDFTREMLLQTIRVVDDVAKGAIDANSAASLLDRISPQFAALYRKALAKSPGVLMFLITLAGLYYARESTLAAQNSKTDVILEHILEEVRDLKHNSTQIERHEPQPHVEEQHRQTPSTNKTPSPSHAKDFNPKRKPKARDIRRKAAKDRRCTMRGDPR